MWRLETRDRYVRRVTPIAGRLVTYVRLQGSNRGRTGWDPSGIRMIYQQEARPTVCRQGQRPRTRGSNCLRRLAGGLGVLMVLASFSCSSAPGSPPWKQVWSDNFNGPAAAASTPGTGSSTPARGSSAPARSRRIPRPWTTSTRTVTATSISSPWDTAPPGAAGSGWTSARVRTKSQFAAQAGGEMMVTASIQQPGPANALGYWPGFWMLGPGTWPKLARSTSWRTSTA